MTARQSVAIVLKGGLVGGTTMGLLTILLPREPVYVALAMAVGLAAGNLTWRPTGFSTQKHLLSAAIGGVVMFAITLSIQLATGAFY